MRAESIPMTMGAQLLALLEDGTPRPPAPPCPCGCLSHHPICVRCARTASAAEKRGEPAPECELVESSISKANGQRYFGGLCRECADLEWSLRWDRAYLAAADEKRKKLLEAVTAREKGGRNYLGVKRPGGPSNRPHAEGCRCRACRQARAEETSLFPPGHEPEGARS